MSDFFLSETAALAHVVLPSAQWAEEDGTMTNLEGRVILRSRALPAARRRAHRPRSDRRDRGGARPRRLVPVEPRHAKSSTSCAGPAPAAPADYRGITYERIRKEDGVFWPCPDPTHPGTPRLFVEQFPTPSGRARFHAVRHQGPAEIPDGDFPLILTTGRVLAHYQSGTQTRRIAELQALAPEPFAEIHPATAARLGVADGGEIVLTTRRGSTRLPARLTEPSVKTPCSCRFTGAASSRSTG